MVYIYKTMNFSILISVFYGCYLNKHELVNICLTNQNKRKMYHEDFITLTLIYFKLTAILGINIVSCYLKYLII